MRTTTLVVALALLAGCESGPEYWSQAQGTHKNTVEWVLLDHNVMFAPGSTTLSGGEKARLDSFLARNDADRRDVIYVQGGGERSAERRQLVEAVLRKYDLDVAEGNDYGSGAAFAGEHVTVSLGRYQVLPPDCPNWQKPPGLDPNNTTYSNYGCAAETNLGLMVADPRDLVVGATAGPSDGAANALGVNRYRRGKAYSPRVQTTTD